MSGAGQDYLLTRVGLVEDRIRALVELRRRDDPSPDDPFRGLYISDEAVQSLLLVDRPTVPVVDDGRRRAAERDADLAAAAGEDVRLRRLARAAGLTPLDSELLLIALLPDLDSRLERLYGYLNDDVTRRRATVGLALELAGAAPVSASARSRVLPGAPLIDCGLLLVDDADRPFLTRALRIPDRVAGHLLGDDSTDPALSPSIVAHSPYRGSAVSELVRALDAGISLVHIREKIPGTGISMAATALSLTGAPVLCVDLERLVSELDPPGVVTVLAREALLRSGGIAAGPVEALAAVSSVALRRLSAMPVPVLLSGMRSWDPLWSDGVPLLVEPELPDAAERADMWRRALADAGPGAEPSAVRHFLLGPAQVDRAVRAARASSLAAGVAPTGDHLRRGARAQNAAGLERLARRIEPRVSWSDLVLPPAVLRALSQLAARARHRDRVLGEWQMRPGGGRGRGITALFAGDSGTGKTMSAEVIAADLGLDLYTINLATVIDKYIGETEKNLERIFAEASGVNAVLLFDEADAIFGKRSEVRDAHDRYANIESAYLLQRMETFDGLAILATNLRSNIDEAFTRRLDSIVDFPAPTGQLRLALWQRCLAPPLPCASDLDLDFCAEAFPLSGGNIRSVAVTAAFQAAAADRAVTTPDLIDAIQQEYRKLGRLVLEQEFGHYLRQSL